MKKNGKIFLLVAIGLVSCLLTWFISAGSYNEGLFVDGGIGRVGIFDYFLVLYYSLYYRASDILYLLAIGGFYGVISQTDGYRKLISKMVNLIGGKEFVAMLIVTFVMGVYTSMAGQILPLLIVVPFIMTVFLKRGCDRITAISASVGGIFIGSFGLTFGTYGIGELMTSMGLTITSGLVFKIIMFVFAYGLFNLFAILRMRKAKTVNELKYDMFTTKKLDETNVKKKDQKKIWPTVVFLTITLLVMMLGYITWSESFNIKIFDDFLSTLKNFTLADVPVVTSILGSFAAFGKWTDMLPLTFVLVVSSLLISLVNKQNLNTWLENFGSGMKKMTKVAIIYTLCMSIFVVCYYFSWPVTFINWLLGSGKFNVFGLLIVAMVMGLLMIDPEYIGYIFGTFLTATFAEHLVATEIIIHLGWAFTMVVAPTSFMLMIALSYLDVTYKDWMKYIWKFALSMFGVALIALAIMCYI